MVGSYEGPDNLYKKMPFHIFCAPDSESMRIWGCFDLLASKQSDTMSPPNVYSALVAQILLAVVMPGVHSPPVAQLTCLACHC